VADYATDYVGVADDDAEFEVERERLVSEIGAAEQRDAFVGGDQLGVLGRPGGPNHGVPVFGPSPECGVLTDGLEGYTCSYRPVQRTALVGCTLQNEVDPHASLGSSFEFALQDVPVRRQSPAKLDMTRPAERVNRSKTARNDSDDAWPS
jgi:hypothetical protein